MNAEKNAAMQAVLKEALKRYDLRRWASHPTGPMSFEVAVGLVEKVFREQEDVFQKKRDAEETRLESFQERFVEFGRHFTSSLPEPHELEEVIVKSATCRYAFMALELLNKITPRQIYPALDEWDREVFLEIRTPPPLPKGASRNKFLSRDVLITGQIEQLVALGFSATRNSEGKKGGKKQSACDVIATATHRLSRATAVAVLEYGAVEQIWKKRNSRKNMTLLGELLGSGLITKT